MSSGSDRVVAAARRLSRFQGVSLVAFGTVTSFDLSGSPTGSLRRPVVGWQSSLSLDEALESAEGDWWDGIGGSCSSRASWKTSLLSEPPSIAASVSFVSMTCKERNLDKRSEHCTRCRCAAVSARAMALCCIDRESGTATGTLRLSRAMSSCGFGDNQVDKKLSGFVDRFVCSSVDAAARGQAARHTSPSGP